MSDVIATRSGSNEGAAIQTTSRTAPVTSRNTDNFLIVNERPAPAIIQSRAPANYLIAKGPDHPPVIAVRDLSERDVVSAGVRGPKGAQGIPGPAGGSAFVRTAGETISALRVLYEDAGEVFYLDPLNDAHIDQLLGLSLSAALPGEALNVQRSGELTDNGWNWVPGRIWLGAGGTLTQVPPVAGYDVLIGTAVSSRSILFNIQDPIFLE